MGLQRGPCGAPPGARVRVGGVWVGMVGVSEKQRDSGNLVLAAVSGSDFRSDI